MSVGVRAAPAARVLPACARSFALQSAARASAFADARSAAAAAKSALRRAARRHRQSAATAGVRNSQLRSRLARDHHAVSSRVAPGVARWSDRRSQVKRSTRSRTFLASSAARERVPSAKSRWRRHDFRRPKRSACRLPRSASRPSANISLATADACRRRHNLRRHRARSRPARSSARCAGWRRHGLRAQVSRRRASPAVEVAAHLRWRWRNHRGRWQRQPGCGRRISLRCRYRGRDRVNRLA